MTAIVKIFSKTIAFVVLAVFGSTFVALESHGTSLCADSVTVHQAHFAKNPTKSTSLESSSFLTASKPESQKSKPSEKRDCHCAHSANCSVLLPIQITSQLYCEGRSRHFSSEDHAYSTFIDSLIKPPRA